MKVEDLLLIDEEVWKLYQEFPEEEQGQYERRLCRAQAAKVLAALITHFYALRTERGDYAANSISDIMVGVGLTWPPKEG